ncbi:hypothetical protein [Aphanothece sacrum]|uniref:PEP-CTERM sorting domain-containing protein n=2 Tax=Aphanothece sacrum TaxID=1122 RepID=A0A401IGW5_APHSA|nr:hypothetical protein [Aphanothece sacrum]GBF80440.1 hypothetical protein AsFPU1_1841 [Aphanothece sacrum FPU1]GBF85521.1 hypothetical protein AsFPU3_2583 [Aphanothece sacrum FPU3]
MLIGVISAISIPTPSLGAVANFDKLNTGFFGSSITNNGITFSNLIAGFRSSPPEFVVKSGNQFNSVFSRPNYLTFGSSIVANGNSSQIPDQPLLGGFGSMTITPEKLATSVSLSVLTTNPNFDFGSFDDSLVLQAFLKGESVGSTSVPIANFSKLNRSGKYLFSKLSLSNIIFDELQLFTPRAFADGVISLGVDNVNITTLNNKAPRSVQPSQTALNNNVPGSVQPLQTVPESQPITLLGLFFSGIVGYLVKRRQTSTES